MDKIITFKQFLKLAEDINPMAPGMNPQAAKLAAQQKLKPLLQQQSGTAKNTINQAIKILATQDPQAAQVLVNPEDQNPNNSMKPKMMRK